MALDTPPMTTLEENLQYYFKEVEPDPIFLQSLETRLLEPAPVRVEKAYRRLSAIVVIGAGLSVGVLFYWVFRGLRSLFR